MNIKDFILGYLIGKNDGGGGSGVDVEPLTVTENGEYSEEGVAYSPVTVNVSGGGGGLEYETGTYTPTADIDRPTISFANQHSTPPMFLMMADATGTNSPVSGTNHAMIYGSWNSAFGNVIVPDTTPVTENYGLVGLLYNTTRSTTSLTTKESIPNSVSEAYWVNNTGFMPSTASNSRYWKAGRTYKWIAVWAPTA